MSAILVFVMFSFGLAILLTLALSMPLGIMATGVILRLAMATDGEHLASCDRSWGTNNWGQYAFKYMQDSGTPDREMLALNLGSLALLFVGVMLLRNSRKTAAVSSAP